MLLVGLGALLAAAMVSHAAAQPEIGPVAIAFHFLHLLGAAAWVGVLSQLYLTRRLLLGAADAGFSALGLRDPICKPLTNGIVQRIDPAAEGTVLTEDGL